MRQEPVPLIFCARGCSVLCCCELALRISTWQAETILLYTRARSWKMEQTHRSAQAQISRAGKHEACFARGRPCSCRQPTLPTVFSSPLGL